MATTITKVVRPNDLRESYARLDSQKDRTPTKITIIIVDSGHCSPQCPHSHNHCNITYGCNLCIEETGPGLRRIQRCQMIFGS